MHCVERFPTCLASCSNVFQYFMNYKIQEDRKVVPSSEDGSVLNMVVYNICFVKTKVAPKNNVIDWSCMHARG